ncbi:proteasomal ubiquitin receptor ADRM1 homolog [Phlebotomus argentipes]|uniref:proteasomal ubiquitin receptor ADRM1 homolog n=1 Tax=Phlebotomus argentipes TaxID=94469 RepID=UPI002892F1B8|nr:proteasomal ubiquitin receptor ADRM1 homolog [Phlebotomus argentipes]
MSGPIFGNTSSSGLSSTNNSRHLVEFRAGRMNMVGKMVHPDTRKGLVYVYQSDDGLIHFCWKDRTTGNTEDDLIIFPDDCEFKKIEQCTSGRVYLLKFKSSSRKLFFWMQETKTDKDDEWCRRINDVINNPPTNIPSGGRGSDNSDLQYMLNNMSQQQLMQLFGGVGQIGGLSSLFGGNARTSESSSARNTPSGTGNGGSGGASATAVTPPPVTSSGSAAAAPKKTSSSNSSRATNNGTSSDNSNSASDKTNVLLSELQSYLSEFSPSGATGSQRNRGVKPVELSAILNTDSLNNILSDDSCRQSLEPFLPKTAAKEPVEQQIRDTVASPQFQQALSMFNNALQSGQLGPVFSQFNLGVEAVTAANDGDTESFLQALEKSLTDQPETKAEEK